MSFTEKRLVTETYEFLPRAVEAKASIAIVMSESLITFFKLCILHNAFDGKEIGS